MYKRLAWFMIASFVTSIMQAQSEPLATAMNARASSGCHESDVLILGAGAAGIGAAKTLHANGISNFVILEYNNQIGGRLHSTPFGRRPDGSQYVVELGGNWITGLTSENGTDNPIWALAKEYDLKSTLQYFNVSSVYDSHGRKALQPDDDPLWKRFGDVVVQVFELGSELGKAGGPDRTILSALRQLGWHSADDTYAQDLELVAWTLNSVSSVDRISIAREVAQTQRLPEDPQFDDRNNLVLDPRGFSYLFKAEAAKFLQPNDTRLQLNTVVTNVIWSDDGVTATARDGRCFAAKHAICTFSLGVLQNALSPSVAPVSFSPEFPDWKREAIAGPDFGIYTKLFLQFPSDQQFWPSDELTFMYVHPSIPGRYTIWQSLSTPGFLPGSGIIFANVHQSESRRLENQDENVTKAELLEVLHQMFPEKPIPEPLDFKFMHWGQTPWSFGSYSSTPADMTRDQFADLKRPVGKLQFAGEHTSESYQGFVHGAYTEGLRAGERVAKLLERNVPNV